MLEQTEKKSMNKAKAPRKKKGTDLAEIYRAADEMALLQAINIGDRPVIVKYLHKLSDHLPQEIVNKLADYLDPDRPTIKSGPKPRKKRSWMFGYQAISHYHWLCEDREIARLTLNRGKEAFQLVEDSELWDAEGKFSPQWKYPHRKRDRELVELPKKKKIKDHICEMFHINSRTFDDLLAKYNKHK